MTTKATSTSDWKQEFFDLFAGATLVQDELDQALRLKHDNTPSALFRYRTCSNRNLDNLKKGIVRLSSPEEFNDPHDSELWLDESNLLEAMTSELRDSFIGSDGHNLIMRKLFELIMSVIQRLYKPAAIKARRELRRVRSSLRVCCFSEENHNTLMWSHYSNSHQGYCEEYNFSLLSEEELHRRMLFPVYYKPEVLDLTPIFYNLMKHQERGNPFASIIAASVKSMHWEYEKEWRLIIPITLEGSQRLYPMPKPTGLYLGSKISETNREKLMEVASNRNIAVYEIATEDGTYDLIYMEW